VRKLFDLEDSMLMPKDMLHSLAVKILEKHKAKIRSDMLKRHLLAKDVGEGEVLMAQLDSAILVLLKNRDAATRNLRLV